MNIIIVGAGPAGMMAAIRSAECGAQVTLYERNPTLGKKLLLSGKGRCNLTNSCGLDEFLRRYSHGGQFLRSAYGRFFNTELISFFESRGLALRVERQGRVFPETDKAESVLEVLRQELSLRGVKQVMNTRLKEIVTDHDRVSAVMLEDDTLLAVDKVILATGGISYPGTGSTGDGLAMAEKLGHTLAPLRPGLVALKTKQQFPQRVEGLTLRNIRLTFFGGKKKIISEVGELMFTAFGVSGPLVLTHSGAVADWLAENLEVRVDIDLKPGLTEEQLQARLLREFKAQSRSALKNVLKELLPRNFIPEFLLVLKLNPDKQASQITQEERRSLIAGFKGFRLDISATAAIGNAMVTKGGIALNQIDPRTMQSRLIKGLYFAGELIDIDADTGGFNLQAAFSTGYLAGESAAFSFGKAVRR